MNICLPFSSQSCTVSKMEFTFGLLLVLPSCILGYNSIYQGCIFCSVSMDKNEHVVHVCVLVQTLSSSVCQSIF